MTVPTADHIVLYRRCLGHLAELDPYAELLVSMHCAGLYGRSRATLPGFSAKHVKPNESALVHDFVQGLRLRQLRLKVDLCASAATKSSAEENQVQMNYQRMEALDRLSLLLCLNCFEGATIESVPVDNEGSQTDLQLRAEGHNSVLLTPYPFRCSPLQVSILARPVPHRLRRRFGFAKSTGSRAIFRAALWGLIPLPSAESCTPCGHECNADIGCLSSGELPSARFRKR